MDPRRLLFLAILATVAYLVYVNVISPPKPSVVVVQPPRNATPQPAPSVMVPSAVVCDRPYIRIGGLEACGVIQYGDSYVVVAAPGWLQGTFSITSIQGTCVFNTAGNRLGLSGNCVIYVTPSR